MSLSLEGRGLGEGETTIDYLIDRLNEKGRTRLCNIKIKRIYITYYLSQYC